MRWSAIGQTVGLLTLSNLFMTYAWYGHLKTLAGKPWYIAALLSWAVAFFEYMLQVPANRIGFATLTLPQLKIIQEVITLIVFVPFALLYMKQTVKFDYLYAALWHDGRRVLRLSRVILEDVTLVLDLAVLALAVLLLVGLDALQPMPTPLVLDRDPSRDFWLGHVAAGDADDERVDGGHVGASTRSHGINGSSIRNPGRGRYGVTLPPSAPAPDATSPPPPPDRLPPDGASCPRLEAREHGQHLPSSWVARAARLDVGRPGDPLSCAR
jgi:uncharacterized protein